MCVYIYKNYIFICIYGRVIYIFLDKYIQCRLKSAGVAPRTATTPARVRGR